MSRKKRENKEKTFLGRNINFLVKQKKIKKHELAKQIGVEPQQVSRWSNDESGITDYNLTKLCRFFGVSRDQMLDVYLEHELPNFSPRKIEQETKGEVVIDVEQIEENEGDEMMNRIGDGLCFDKRINGLINRIKNLWQVRPI